MGNIVNNITFNADVKSVLNSVQDIQNGLNKLAIPPSLRANFDKIFNDMEAQVKRATDAMDSGFKNQGSVTAFNQALKRIIDDYNDIITKTQTLEAKNKTVLSSVDTQTLDKLKQQVSDLEKKANAAQTNLSKVATATVQGISDSMNTLSKKASSSNAWKQISTLVNDVKNGKITLDEFKQAVEQVFQVIESRAQGKTGDYWDNQRTIINDTRTALKGYETAVQSSTQADQKLQTAQAALNQVYGDGKAVLQQMETAAKQGAVTSGEYAAAMGKVATQSHQLSSELEQFKNKIAYFFGLSNAINLFKNAVRSAYNTVKDLDAVMTETAVVTDFKVSDMWEKLPEYTQRANELGVSIHSAYESATIFYQQGLKTNEVIQISTETLKMARIAGLDAATASDRMTNALRGFNMEMDKLNAQRVNDVYSKLAAITASNTDEISTAMTKVASLAHNANMEFETTAAFLAQIIESTRESAETAGTALKTVVARFSEVKKLYSEGELLGTDLEGEEIDVNKVATALRSANINLNEYLTGMKGLDDIFLELAEKWDSLDIVQQRYIATMAAGSRQQSRFIALMSDYKRTIELVDAANNANGASNEQYGKTLDSLETKVTRLKNAWNELMLGLANSEVIKGGIDLLTQLLTALNTLIDKMSGSSGTIKMFETFLVGLASFKIGSSLIGKSSIFGDITKIGRTQAITSGNTISAQFYGSLADGIAKGAKSLTSLKTNGLTATISNTFSSLFSKENYFSTSQDFRNALYSQIDLTKMDTAAKQELLTTLQKQNVTVGEVNAVLAKNNVVMKDSGQQAQITEANYQQFGLTSANTATKVNTLTMVTKLCATAFIVAGSACLVWASQLEQGDESAQQMSIWVKGIGVALLGLGTVMSVYIPLHAQLMARGVSTAILSIPIIGLIAALAAVATAITYIAIESAKFNSLSAQLERAEQAADGARDAADEAAQKYRELGEAWEELETKQSIIEDATKGTQEWRDAVQDLNTEVLNLQENYRNVQVGRNADGTLYVKNRDEVEATYKQSVIDTEAAARYSQILATQKNIENEISVFGASRFERGISTATLQDIYDSGSASEWAYNKTDTEIEELLVTEYQNLGKGFEDVKNDISGARKQFQQLAQMENELGSYYTTFGASVIENANVAPEYSVYVDTLVDDEFIKTLQRDIADNDYEVGQRYNDWDQISGTQLKKAYAEALNYDSWEQLEENEETDDLTEAQMRNYLKTQDMLDLSNDRLDLFVSNLDELTENQLTFFEASEGGGFTQEQLKEMLGDNVFELSEDALNKAIENYDFETIYTNLGGDDVFGVNGKAAFEEFIKNSLYSAVNTFDFSEFEEAFTDKIDTSLTDSLDAAQFKDFTNQLWLVYSTSGEEAMTTLQKSIKEVGAAAHLNEEEMDNFIKTLNSLDWTSADSIATLSSYAEYLGISEEALNSLENQLIEFNNAINSIDLDKITESLTLAKSIQTGDHDRSFTEEERQTAINNGVTDEFIYNIETGDYSYVGDDIQTVVDTIKDKTNQIIAQLDKRNESYEAIEATISDIGRLEEKTIEAGTGGKQYSFVGYTEEDLKKFFTEYMTIAGEDSVISQDFIDNASYDQLVARYNDLINDYELNYAGTRQELDDLRSRTYQTNTAAENGEIYNATGNSEVRDVLKNQIYSSGLSEAVQEVLIESISSISTAATPETGGYMTYAGMNAVDVLDTVDRAAQFGFDAETLEAYVNALSSIEELQDLEIDRMYSLALANANYQTGLTELIDSYDDWSGLIQDDGSIVSGTSIADMEAFNDLKKNLKQMFNLTEDISDEFFKLPGIAELLEAAIEGDEDAIIELRKELIKFDLEASGIDLSLRINPEDEMDLNDTIDAIINESRMLEFGASINDSMYAQQLFDMMVAAGATAEEIQEAFNEIGWDVEIGSENVPIDSTSVDTQSSTITYNDPVTGKPYTRKVTSTSSASEQGFITVPTFNGKGSYVGSSIPSVSSSASSDSGSSGGSSSSEETPSYWENPYDELYNLQEKINEALRTREALERNYQKLLKQEAATLSDIRKSYYDQINNLRAEANLQEQLAAGRLRQINNIGSELYTDDEGNRTSYSSLGVTKYASYNADTGLITIDWEGLEAIANDSSREEEGNAAEAYISRLEELVEGYEDIRDTLWDIEDEIEDLRDSAIDSYTSFEDRLLDAVINKYQAEIDSYQAMSDAIDEANTEVIDSLREQIDLSRQIRDNTEKEEDIADKENRLAYLQRDTSGANDLEILKLQKEIDDARQSYSDTLIDQAIDQMQTDADLAAEQRARQIDTMTEQLEIMKENGDLWQEVYNLMNDAAAGDGALSPKSELVRLLEQTEAYESLSNIGKAQWWENVAEEFHAAWVGLSEAEDKYKTDANNDGTITNSGTSSAIANVATSAESVSTSTEVPETNNQPEFDEKTKYGVALAVCDGYWGNGQDRVRNLESKGFNYNEIQGIVNKIFKSTQSGAWYGKYYGITNPAAYKMSAFKEGGLADFTGPAWLDGTKSKPELILNAQDSANFIALKDILASLLNAQTTNGGLGKGGDNYFDIDISANIGSDYDVDKLTEKIKKDIYNDGQYRNVNTINFLR